MDYRFIALAIAFAAADASAAKLNKCVDSSGHVTFTQAACPGGVVGESITVHQGGAGMSLGPVGTLAMPAETPSYRRPFNHCGDLTQVDIVHLTGNSKVRVGMTADDVEKSWGPPEKINRSSYGSDQWVYDGQYVYVDSSGCVTAWN